MSDPSSAAARRQRILARGKDRLSQITGVSSAAERVHSDAGTEAEPRPACPEPTPAHTSGAGGPRDTVQGPSVSPPAESVPMHTPLPGVRAVAEAATAADVAEEEDELGSLSGLTLEAAGGVARSSPVSSALGASPTSSLGSAVRCTKLLRAVLAMLLAWAVFSGNILPGALPLPLLLAFNAFQMIISLVTWSLLARTPLGAWVKAGEAAGPTAALPLHLRGLDLASLVPGLKPAMQGLSSITILTSSMWEGAAVFVVVLGGLNTASAISARI